MRLIVDAVETQSAGEIEDRFLFAELPQHLGRGLQRGKLAVGIKDVELAIVLPEGRSRIRRAVVADVFI